LKKLLYSAISAGILAALSLWPVFWILWLPGFCLLAYVFRQPVHSLNWHTLRFLNFVFYFVAAYCVLYGIEAKQGHRCLMRFGFSLPTDDIRMAFIGEG